MPIEQRKTSGQLRAVSIALAVLAAAVALTVLFFQFAGNGTSTSGGGTSSASSPGGLFAAGRADRLSKSIAKDGPLLFSDVSGRGQRRPLFLSHEGPSPRIGWTAFAAQNPGDPAGCYLQWVKSADHFVGRDEKGKDCGSMTFPKSGDGLPSYRVVLRGSTDNAEVLIDLTVDKASTTTTT